MLVKGLGEVACSRISCLKPNPLPLLRVEKQYSCFEQWVVGRFARMPFRFVRLRPSCKVNWLYRAYLAALGAHSEQLNVLNNLFVLLYTASEVVLSVEGFFIEQSATF